MNFKKIFIVAVLSNDDKISSRSCLKTGPGLKKGVKNDIFGLKWGQDLENRAAHPSQEFPGVPPPRGQYNSTGGNSCSIAFIWTQQGIIHKLKNSVKTLCKAQCLEAASASIFTAQCAFH